MSWESEYYGTAKEVEFIKNLGSCTDKHHNRLELLRGYLRGCKLRQEWGHINKHHIFETVLLEIKKEESGK